jgi:rubrerythrin
MQWNTIDDVLDFAIREEEKAAEFYAGLAGRAEHAAMREVFETFAAEEQGHKAKILAVKAGKEIVGSKAEVLDLKLGDYLVEVEPSPDMSYQDALIVAMKKEKAAFKLYQDLATLVQDDKIKRVFLGLAQEEAKHKLRFEMEYDDLLTED